MFALARIDYSRFRELRVGIYTAMIFTIVLVLVLGVAALGARRWIELPFFQFQPSELGKLLLVLALAGFSIDRARRQTAWQRTARLLLLGFVPALIVFVQPDLGTALVYGVVTLAILFVSGTPWQHFAALGGIALAAVTVVLIDRAGGRTSGAPRVSARSADVVPQSERRPRRLQLSDQSGAHRHRLRAESSAAAMTRHRRSTASFRKPTPTSSSPRSRSDGGSSALRSFYPSTRCSSGERCG